MAATDSHLRRGFVLSAVTGLCVGFLTPLAGYGAGGYLLLSVIIGTLWFLINGKLGKTQKTFVYCSSIFVALFVMEPSFLSYVTKSELIYTIGGFIVLPTFVAAIGDYFLAARLKGEG